jgi:two-component system response regulator MprA
VLRYSDLTLNTATREVTRAGRNISLTPQEFDLLVLFLRNPRQVLKRDLIYERVWGYDFEGESNVIEVYVRYLRNKLDPGGSPLDYPMPRWQMSSSDLNDLIACLMTLK